MQRLLKRLQMERLNCIMMDMIGTMSQKSAIMRKRI